MNGIKLAKIPKQVLSIINDSKYPLRPVDIQSLLGPEVNIRSIRYAINILEENGLVERNPDFNDLRSFYIKSKRII